MRSTLFFLIVAIVILFFLFSLVRSRKLREKYVLLWMAVGLMVIVLTVYPPLLSWMTEISGISLASNLLFVLSILLLLGVTLHLTLEISRSEDHTRTLAENVAILNLQIKNLEEQLQLRDFIDADPYEDKEITASPETGETVIENLSEINGAQ